MQAATATLDRRRPRLLVNPRFRAWLEQHGLTEVSDFLDLPGEVICGHRHRHVARIQIGNGDSAIGAYLKRELHVPWKVYLGSAWAGRGWASLSAREAATLQEAAAAAVGCPDWIAAGEDADGRAFVLVRELTGARELRAALAEAMSADECRALARRLGAALDRLHAAGFAHGDLHSKHVFVGPMPDAVHFLDWQRARRHRRLSWRRRLADLALLDATLAGHLASDRERLACLRAYLHAAPARSGVPSLRRAARFIRRHARLSLRKRYIREIRQALPMGEQHLICLDGEAVCVTRGLPAQTCERLPSWVSQALTAGRRNTTARQRLDLPGIGPAVLVCRRVCRPLRWLWSWLRGRSWVTPEMRQAALLFRLQRYGIHTPRLLAVGQRYARPWQSESFLLTAAAPRQTGLAEWLASQASRPPAPRQYWGALRAAGATLRRLHGAGCYLKRETSSGESSLGNVLGVATAADGSATVVLRSLDGIRERGRFHKTQAIRDLARWCRSLALCRQGRTSALRFLLGYLGRPRATAAEKQLLRSFLRRGWASWVTGGAA